MAIGTPVPRVPPRPAVCVVSPLSEHDFHSLSPALVNAHEGPLNLRRDVPQNDVRRGMHMQRRCDQKEQRRFFRQLASPKVSILQKLPAPLMPLHPRPIIQPLQRQMNVFIRLQLNHGQPSFARQREHVDHGPVGRRKCRHLRIHGLWLEPLINHADISPHQRLQPSLRMHPKQPIPARPIWMPCLAQRCQQLHEETPVAIFQDAFLGSDAEHNLLPALKRDRLSPHARPGKLQASPAKCNLRRRQHRNLAIRQDRLNPGNRLCKPLQRRGLIRRMYQPCRNVSAVGAVDLDHRVVTLIEFKQPPLRRLAIQIRHSLPHQAPNISTGTNRIRPSTNTSRGCPTLVAFCATGWGF